MPLVTVSTICLALKHRGLQSTIEAIINKSIKALYTKDAPADAVPHIAFKDWNGTLDLGVYVYWIVERLLIMIS